MAKTVKKTSAKKTTKTPPVVEQAVDHYSCNVIAAVEGCLAAIKQNEDMILEAKKALKANRQSLFQGGLLKELRQQVETTIIRGYNGNKMPSNKLEVVGAEMSVDEETGAKTFADVHGGKFVNFNVEENGTFKKVIVIGTKADVSLRDCKPEVILEIAKAVL